MRHQDQPGPARTAPAPTPLFRVRELRSDFGGPFNFDLHGGECIAIQGPSGAGKSVLLRMLADLDPHEGEATLDGRARTSMAAPAWRSLVVYQAAEPAWWEDTAGAHFTAAQRPFVDANLGALGLDAATLSAPLERLSTGERQRLALLRSLSRAPRVLLLDEPTAALDPDSVARAEALLEDCLAGGMAIVIVTHAEAQARRLADRIYCLDGGKLSAR